MRTVMVCVAAVVLGLSALACESSSSPSSPSTNPPMVSQSEAVTAQGTPIGLTGAIRGLNLQNGSFSLVTRSATRTVRIDGETQVWSKGAQVRPSALRDGASVSIRGYDYGRYVIARTISIN